MGNVADLPQLTDNVSGCSPALQRSSLLMMGCYACSSEVSTGTLSRCRFRLIRKEIQCYTKIMETLVLSTLAPLTLCI